MANQLVLCDQTKYLIFRMAVFQPNWVEPALSKEVSRSSSHPCWLELILVAHSERTSGKVSKKAVSLLHPKDVQILSLD
jgi:hypothetical protein